MTPPVRSCKDCTDRFPGCHDRCERYKADKEANEAVKQARHDEWLCRSYQVENRLKWKAKRAKRKRKELSRKR